MSRPTIDNWLTEEHVFWSFRHVRELIPTAQVDSSERVRALNLNVDPKLGTMPVTTSAGTVTVKAFLESSHTDSLTVLKGNDIVFEWVANGMHSNEQHLIFSVTKSITSLLTGALVGAGLIDVDELVTTYIPEIAGSGFDGATIRNLLDMTAAYSFVEDYTPGPDIVAYRHSVGWYPAPLDAMNLHQFIASRKPDGPHGDHFRYQSPTTDLLGWVCEAASGLPYAQALSKYIWQPLGAQAPADMTVDKMGSPRAAGGLSVLPRDLARLGMIIRDGGLGIVPAEYIADIFEGGSHEQWAHGDFADLFAHGVYRSCCYRPGEDPDVIMGIGIYGQMLYIDRPRNIVIAKQSSWPMPDELDWHLDAYALCRTIARSLN